MLFRAALLLICLLGHSIYAENLKTQAQQAMVEGDLQGALEHLMMHLEANPGDVEAASTFAALAPEFGMTDLAGTFLVGALQSTVADGNKPAIAWVVPSASCMPRPSTMKPPHSPYTVLPALAADLSPSRKRSAVPMR